MVFVCLYMQSLLDIRHHFINSLAQAYPKEEATTLFHITAEEILGYKTSQVSLHLHDIIDQTSLDKLYTVLQQLKTHKPIQYIFGKAPFYGMNMLVNEHTLIPRPETEELVDMIVKNHQHQEQLKILDIGTGSGCIAIALAKKMNKAQIKAVDISEKAIEIAQQNNLIQQVNVDFEQADITQWKKLFTLTDRYDIIVSNPPYVKMDEKKAMSPNVLNHEPHMALFVENHNPLVFYDRIASMAKQHLLPKGSLYFEINQYLSEETAELIKNKGFSKVTVIKDINNAPRMIQANK